MADTTAPAQVFMSYARANRPIVEKLYAALTARGIQVWIDRSGLEPGTDDWEQAIRDAIRASWAVLFVASPDSRRSRYVKDELRIANMYKCRIYPVWVAGDEIMEALPMGLGGTHTIDLRGGDYESGLNALTAALVKGTGPLPPLDSFTPGEGDRLTPHEPDRFTPIEAVADMVSSPDFVPRNPYKGLKAFTGDDVSDFFGRTRLVDELVDALREATSPSDNPRFLALLVGPSGSGKSSVVMAGLLPRLQQGALPDSDKWIYLDPMVPGSHPLESLALSLASRLPGHSLTTLAGDLKDDAGRGLHLLARQIAGQPNRRVVLLVDQFEELFTLTVDEAERKRFIDLLVTAVMEPRGVLLAILTLRADFYDRPLNYPALGSLLETRSKAILPMDVDDLRDVIEKPADLSDVRLKFDEGLVGDLLFEVRGEAAALPLLQFTLDQLFQRREGLRLTRDAYQEIGGVKGALANHAEATYNELPSDQHKRLARALFLRLIEPGASEQDTTRRRARMSELTLDDEKQTEIYASVARAFVDARLLTTNKFGEHITIEVSHEALIREWERLGNWLKDARDDVRSQKSIAQDTMEWVQRGRKGDDDGLYRGSLLIDALDWAKRNVASADEQAFLEAGAARQAELVAIEERRTQELIEAAERAKQARRIAVAVGLIAAIISIAIFLTAKSAADQATTREEIANTNLTLAANTQVAVQLQNDTFLWARRSNELSQSLAYSDDTVAALLAIRALQGKYSQDALDALNKVLDGFYVPQFLTHGPSTVTSVAISPDGRLGLTGSGDATVRLWDLATGKQILTFIGHTSSVLSVAFAPDGPYMLTGSQDTTARLWDLTTGKSIRTFIGHRGSVTSVAFAPSGKTILTGSIDNSARLWNVATGSDVSLTLTHALDVTSVAYSPDERFILTGSVDRFARLWDASTGQLLRGFVLAGVVGSSAVNDVAFSPDGRYVLTGAADRVARLWDVETGKLWRTYSPQTGNTGASVSSVAFSPNGRYVITGGSANTTWVWDVDNGTEVRTYRPQTPNANGIINNIAISPDGRYALMSSSDNTTRLWDLNTGIEKYLLTPQLGAVSSVAFSPDGRYVVTGGNNNAMRLWDATTNTEVRPFSVPPTGPARTVVSMAFSPNGNHVLTGSTDNIARLWDVATGQTVRTFAQPPEGLNPAVRSVAFSPDGRHVVTGGNNSTARLWDVVTGKLVRTFVHLPSVANSFVTSAAFSPDGRFLLTGSVDRTARLWEVATGQEVRTFSAHLSSVSSVAFSPDGRFVLTGSVDTTIRLWDVGIDKSVQTFTGHTSTVNSVAFSPDGRYVLTGSADSTARLWGVGSDQSLRVFKAQIGPITKVAFSPDGRYALTGSTDSTTRLWAVNYSDVIAYVCTWLSRDFTTEERHQYEINDTMATCPQFANDGTPTLPLPPTTTLMATWTPSTATALPALSPTMSLTVGPTPTRDLTRSNTPINTRTPTNTHTPTATVILSSSKPTLVAPTVSPTFTHMPTITPDLSVLDLGGLANVQPQGTTDGLLLFKRHPRWMAGNLRGPVSYSFYGGGTSGNPLAEIVIAIGEPEVINRTVLRLVSSATTPRAALEAYLQARMVSGFRLNPVTEANIGTVSGYGARFATLSPTAPFQYDVRLAALADGRWVYVAVRSRAVFSEQARPLLEALIASIEVQPLREPTPTVTVVMETTP